MDAKKKWLATAVAGLALAASAVQAAPTRSTGGSFGDLTWSAQSVIVGTKSTATLAGGGNPAYFAPTSRASGTVTLIMDYAEGSFICSGTLLPDRRSILTAGHCVSDGTAARPLATTVFFYDGTDPDVIPFISPAATAISVAQYFVHASYTGEVIDQNDIAVLRLAEAAPAFATDFDLYVDPAGLTGLDFTVAGYGRRSDTGGAVGVNLGAGRLREGDNVYDFRLGDADFGGFWDGFFGTADVTYSYLSDFDGPDGSGNASCLVAGFFGLSGAKYCGTSLGLREVGIAGGDSGGPGFVDGMIATVNSYGLSFGRDFGDIDGLLNTSFGEFSGYVPVYIHEDFIRSAMVPEPGTLALMGLALAGLGVARRRKAA